MGTKAIVYMDCVEVQLDPQTKMRFSVGDGLVSPGIYIERKDRSYARIHIWAEQDGSIVARLERNGKNDKNAIVILPKPKQERAS